MIRVTRQNFCCPSISIQPNHDYLHNHMVNRTSTSLLSLFNAHLRNFKACIVWLSRPHCICGGCHVLMIIFVLHTLFVIYLT